MPFNAAAAQELADNVARTFADGLGRMVLEVAHEVESDRQRSEEVRQTLVEDRRRLDQERHRFVEGTRSLVLRSTGLQEQAMVLEQAREMIDREADRLAETHAQLEQELRRSAQERLALKEGRVILDDERRALAREVANSGVFAPGLLGAHMVTNVRVRSASPPVLPAQLAVGAPRSPSPLTAAPLPYTGEERGPISPLLRPQPLPVPASCSTAFAQDGHQAQTMHAQAHAPIPFHASPSRVALPQQGPHLALQGSLPQDQPQVLLQPMPQALSQVSRHPRGRSMERAAGNATVPFRQISVPCYPVLMPMTDGQINPVSTLLEAKIRIEQENQGLAREHACLAQVREQLADEARDLAVLRASGGVCGGGLNAGAGLRASTDQERIKHNLVERRWRIAEEQAQGASAHGGLGDAWLRVAKEAHRLAGGRSRMDCEWERLDSSAERIAVR